MTPESGPEPKFWQIALADLERRLGADRNGLSSAEVAARRLRYGPNTLEERRRLSVTLKFLSRFRNPLVLLCWRRRRFPHLPAIWPASSLFRQLF